MESLMPTIKGQCYICGLEGYTEKHHCIHGTANRSIADREGLWVWLCPECHRIGKYSVHRYRGTDLHLHKDAQEAWETKYIKDYPYKNHAKQSAREAFIKLFGKSWILEDDND